MSYDEPDDDYMTTEQAIDAGWLSPDEADELRELVKFLDVPTQLTKSHAACILIDHILNGLPATEESQAQLEWARAKLSRT